MAKSKSTFPNDSIMQALYERVETELGHIPEPQVRTNESYFSDLCESIIGQQLSSKAADTIIGRIKKFLPGESFTPEVVLNADTEQLRAAGASYAKISYIKNLASAWQSGEIEYENFSKFSDEEIIKELTQVKGIGRWTAEMFLMFSLCRPDVFSAGDLGLKNAMIKAYGISDKSTKAEINEITEKWTPNRTLACRVLWRSLTLK